MIKIAPSLLSANFARLENEINLLQEAKADMLHLDVMDGHFVPNLTYGLPIIQKIKEISTLPLDVHLMVSNPENYLDTLGKWNIDYVSIHQETVPHLHRQVSQLNKMKVKSGIALNPGTPVESIFPLIADIDFVLIMSVNPGFGGQTFLALVYDKILKLRAYAKKHNPTLEIEVDGGVNNVNSTKLIDSGVDILVAGSYIFQNSDYKEQIKSLRKKDV